MRVTYDFNINACMRRLGLDEGGRVQTVVTNEVINLSERYVPFDEGTLAASARIENKTDVVWGGPAAPYAHYMWGGIVYEDPVLHCAGFQVEDGGFRSRKGVQKVPTSRKLEYQNGRFRGPFWVIRMLQNGGARRIEEKARKAVGR